MMSRRPLAAALALLLCPPSALASSASAGLMSPARMQSGIVCLPVPGVGLRCSDGRVSSTVRASAVPCETTVGSFTYAATNTACVSVRGLEAWAANTTLNTFGNDPSNAAWSKGVGVTVAAGPDGGWRVTKTGAGGNANQVVGSTLGADSTRTTACILKAPSPVPGGFLYVAGGANTCNFVGLTNAWATQSCTKLLTAGTQPLSGFNINDASRPLDVAACWHVASSTPGRPCWQASGAAPFTCADDRHSISSAGFPTTAGRFSVTFQIDQAPGGNQAILDGRTGGTTGSLLYVVGGKVTWWLNNSTRITGPTVTLGVPHVVEIARVGTTTVMKYDGVQVGTSTDGDWSWHASPKIGSDGAGFLGLQGSISRLSWSTQ